MEKEKLIKGLIYIAIIITLCTVASRIFFISGETLQEYAQNNPELAYAVNEDGENDTKDDNAVDVEDNTDKSVSTDTGLTDDASNLFDEDYIPPERVTYQENFYYEPLTSLR